MSQNVKVIYKGRTMYANIEANKVYLGGDYTEIGDAVGLSKERADQVREEVLERARRKASK